MLKVKTTQEVIKEMLKENTGRALGDSGDAYGRHWERNQKIKDFEETPAVTVDMFKGDSELSDLDVTINIYHYLKAHLEYAEDMDNKLKDYIKRQSKESSYLHDMENFGESKGYQIETFNTYNFNCVLSQTLQFTLYKENDDIYSTEYIALQIHGGCDVRGGYTKPRIFKVHDIDYFLMGLSQITCIDDERTVYGYSDDAGYSWYEIDPEEVIINPEKEKIYYRFIGNELNFRGLTEF